MASSKLVLPEAFAPLIRVNRESKSRAADCKQRKSVTCTRRRDNSKPHGHHDVARRGVAGRANQTATVTVGPPELDVLPIDGGQGIQQVVHVEAYFKVATVVAHLDLLLGLLLLGIVRLNRHDIFLHGNANASE